MVAFVGIVCLLPTTTCSEVLLIRDATVLDTTTNNNSLFPPSSSSSSSSSGQEYHAPSKDNEEYENNQSYTIGLTFSLLLAMAMYGMKMRKESFQPVENLSSFRQGSYQPVRMEMSSSRRHSSSIGSSNDDNDEHDNADTENPTIGVPAIRTDDEEEQAEAVG